MSWFDKSCRALGLALLVVAAGCYEDHVCGSPEECDYRDNDCDDVADEAFVDDDGVYFTEEHCGGCGVNCAEVFPTAAATECIIADGGAGCRIVACEPGFHLAGDGACVPDVPVLCLPCEDDSECALRTPGAICVDGEFGGGRCAPPCDGGCPEGTECRPANGDDPAHCFPIGGDCACNQQNDGLVIGCLVDRGDAYQCGGVQVCEDGGLESGYAFSGCEPVLEETCNEQDDDCDGEVDEDFRDELGRYVSRLHCGGCAMPCVEPGENMIAECLPRGTGTSCEIGCVDGFVDVDGILANGCECERWDGVGPPPAIGTDADCDGVVDDTDDFVYVATAGSDGNPGTLAQPVRTLARALALGRTEAKDVLVARGVYDGAFDMVSGVNVFGGYRPDFRDRDLELYPVLIERTDIAPGSPVLTCQNIVQSTRVDGFLVGVADATAPGEGSTAVFLDRCSASVRLTNIEILAGRGSDGARGESSSDNLADWGVASLAELNGENGTNGGGNGTSGCFAGAGRGGQQRCRAIVVNGGNGGDASCPTLQCTQGGACGNAGCTDFTVGGVCDLDAARRVASPNPAAGGGQGTLGGAAGEQTFNAPTNRVVCNFCDDNPTLPRLGSNGADGASGTDGGAGMGCQAAPAVNLTTGRVSGGPGTNGTQGTDGSGGGGGTAGAGYAVIGGTDPGCDDVAGGAGGGGGSGGCGSPGADGGQGGGASVGILVRVRPNARSGPAFENVRVVTASGGAGGDGGIGAAGGTAGTGGIGGSALFWCARTGGRGGDGGRGGAGGGGGGGCGGGSHGVLVLGPEDATYRSTIEAGVTIDATGVAGRGGVGGFSPGDPGTSGLTGSGAAIQFL
ncbi:MAG: hypothetical protein AAGF12_18720 [Myxococcota bacterium]